MSKPWELNGGPGPTVIRDLVLEDGMTALAIAERYKCGRQTVEYWMRQAGLTPSGTVRMNHKKFLPWEVTRADSYDGIANALRGWSKVAQGVPIDELRADDRNRLLAFQAHLAKYDRVVDYSRDEARLTGVGWMLVPRDPKVDDPALPIRRPV